MDVNVNSQGRLTPSGDTQKNFNQGKVQSGKDIIVNNNSGNSDSPDNNITEKQIKNVVDKMNKLLDNQKTHVEYEVHRGLMNAVIKIVDNNTNEVVKQIPAKQVVDAMEGLYNAIGIMFDKNA